MVNPLVEQTTPLPIIHPFFDRLQYLVLIQTKLCKWSYILKFFGFLQWSLKFSSNGKRFCWPESCWKLLNFEFFLVKILSESFSVFQAHTLRFKRLRTIPTYFYIPSMTQRLRWHRCCNKQYCLVMQVVDVI